MRITLTTDEGTLIDMWTTDDEDDYGIVRALAEAVSMGPTKRRLEGAAIAMEDRMAIIDQETAS